MNRPRSLIKCPSCGYLKARETLISGNTIGARFYSDGRCDAPMFPDTPIYVKCSTCDAYYKVDKTVINGQSEDFTTTLSFVEFMSIEDYVKAINIGLHNAKAKGSKEWENDQLSLRLLLWRAFNERGRKDGTQLRGNDNADVDATKVYEDNCLEILDHLRKSSNDEDYLIRAEIHRNLSQFDLCKEMLKRIENHGIFGRYITFINAACDVGNTLTVSLDNEFDKLDSDFW